MTLLQAILLAIVQGATELFPVSSLGHAVLVPALLHWHMDEHDPLFLPYVTMLHFGTLIALFVFFWRDWFAILGGATGMYGRTRQADSIRILALIVVATIPAIIVGGILEHKLRALFGSPVAAASFLIVNGLLLLFVEWRRNQMGSLPDRPIATLTFRDSIIIGIWQCLALIPGISRSGATINGGLLRGLSHETATRFSLLMAQPVILAATANQAFKLRHITITHDQMTQGLIGAAVAGITALVCTAILIRTVHNHDRWALSPFGFYCIGGGIIFLGLLAL